MQKAHVRPLLKKTSLSKKRTEKLEASYIQHEFHFRNLNKSSSQSAGSSYKNNHLSNSSQSAFRQLHSTESALLKVHNDIIISMGKGEVTALTLLNMSAAAFNTIYATLTDRLSDRYGLSGQAKFCFSSYLKNRH